MNERIKELIKQATTEEHDSFRYFDKKKFAELIIRECIQVSGPEDSYTDEWFEAKVDSVQKIKKHFGVTE
jgi:hypothetical protein